MQRLQVMHEKNPETTKWMPHFEFVQHQSFCVKILFKGQFSSETELFDYVHQTRSAIKNEYLHSSEMEEKVKEL